MYRLVLTAEFIHQLPSTQSGQHRLYRENCQTAVRLTTAQTKACVMTFVKLWQRHSFKGNNRMWMATSHCCHFLIITTRWQPVRTRPAGRCSAAGWWCVWWAGVCWAGWTERTRGSPVWSQRCQRSALLRLDPHPAPLRSHCKCQWDALEEGEGSQSI